jgi:hypothetical protein
MSRLVRDVVLLIMAVATIAALLLGAYVTRL